MEKERAVGELHAANEHLRHLHDTSAEVEEKSLKRLRGAEESKLQLLEDKVQRLEVEKERAAEQVMRRIGSIV